MDGVAARSQTFREVFDVCEPGPPLHTWSPAKPATARLTAGANHHNLRFPALSALINSATSALSAPQTSEQRRNSATVSHLVGLNYSKSEREARSLTGITPATRKEHIDAKRRHPGHAERDRREPEEDPRQPAAHSAESGE